MRRGWGNYPYETEKEMEPETKKLKNFVDTIKPRETIMAGSQQKFGRNLLFNLMGRRLVIGYTLLPGQGRFVKTIFSHATRRHSFSPSSLSCHHFPWLLIIFAEVNENEKSFSV